MAAMPALLRFAPSPTGQLHLGGLRMAMINQLVARKLGGKWILRIEDTDQKRLVPGSLQDIESSLEWAGLEYDYGPNKSGPHGPYFQSDRLDLYAHHAKSLLESGNAYRCFCSAERLAETRERLQHAGSHATYDRACLHLSEEEVARRVRAGEKHVVRVRDDAKPALGRKLDVNEMIFPRQFQPSTSRATDTILIKADSFPTYHFASVVDDHAMGISHVIRGEEWLPSLPLHAQLYDLLGWKPPNFAHIPILLNADGSKMSKRKGDAHVADFIRAGWEPEAVINWLAIAGWSSKAPSTPANPQGKGKSKGLPTDDTLTLPELEQKFDLSNVTHRRNILDKSKLESLNRQHLQKKIADPEGADSIVQRMLPKLHAQFPNNISMITPDYIRPIFPLLIEKTSTLDEATTYAPYFFQIEEGFMASRPPFQPRADATEEALGPMLQAMRSELSGLNMETLPTDGVAFRKACEAVQKQLNVPQRSLMYALRWALTGMQMGPSILHIMHVLGMEKTLSRLDVSTSMKQT